MPLGNKKAMQVHALRGMRAGDFVTRGRPASVKKRPDELSGRIASSVCVAVLFGLAILDWLSSSSIGRSAIFLAVSYSLRAAVAAFVVWFGLIKLLKAHFGKVWRTAMVLFVIMTAFWSVLWIVHRDYSNIVTILFNPRFSLLAWNFSLLIPFVAVANRDGRLTRQMSRVPPELIVGSLLVAVAVFRFVNVEFDSAPASLAVAFVICCRPAPRWIGSQIWRAGLCFATAAASAISGSRTYFIAIILLGLSFIFFKRLGWKVTAVIVVTYMLTPVIYYYVITNYTDHLSLAHSKAFVDTRSFLFLELFDDLSWREIITGRGPLGTYFSPYFSILEKSGDVVGADHAQRFQSEVSWLNMILKFGLIGLIPYLIVILVPISTSFKAPSIMLPLDGMRRFAVHVLLIFSAELPNAISASYFSFYIALGTLLVCRIRPRSGSANQKRTRHTRQPSLEADQQSQHRTPAPAGE